MNIYILRHGITIAHENDRRQTNEDILSDTGIVQAQNIGIFLKEKQIDSIICSSTSRTKHTAEVIAQVLDFKKGIIKTDVFKEAKRPSELLGKAKGSPEVKQILTALSQNASTPGWRYSDEETFEELKERTIKAKKYIQDLNSENLLIITHGTFGKLFLATLIFKGILNFDTFEHFRKSIKLGYTGLISCGYKNDALVIEEIKNI